MPPYREFLDHALAQLAAEPWLVGIAAGGSYATGTMDEFSDLDLTLAVEDDAYAEVMARRPEIAGKLGPLLTHFTGEHVGEPRLLLCLYGPPPLHVDFVFTKVADLARRFEDPEILFDRDSRVAQAIAGSPLKPSGADPQWYEDRFWVWVHKAAAKIGRGELFEAVEYLAFLRKRVLAPLANPGKGLRFLDSVDPSLAGTIGAHDRSACLDALRATVEAYRRLRPTSVSPRSEAERAVTAYLDALRPSP